MKTQPRTLGDLTPAPYNPRKISAEKLDSLGRSLERFGPLDGFIYNRRTKRLIGGHQRQKKMPPGAELSITETYDPPTENGTVAQGYITAFGEKWPFREVDVDEQTEAAMNIAANAHGGEFDFPKLADVVSELAGFDFPNIEDIGFNEKEIERMLSWTPPPGEPGIEHEIATADLIEYSNAPVFASDEPFGFPPLLLNRMSEYVPHRLWTTTGDRAVSNPIDVMSIVGVGPRIPLQNRGTILCYAFREDEILERAWFEVIEEGNHIKEYYSAVVTPDLSTWPDDPLAVSIWNVYRNRWIGRVWQEMGINIIPAIDFVSREHYDWWFAGIPEGTPVLACQCRTGDNTDETRHAWLHGINYALAKIKPRALIIYGGEQHLWVRGNLPDGIEYVYLPSVPTLNRENTARMAAIDREHKLQHKRVTNAQIEA